MPFIGSKPAQSALTSAHIADGAVDSSEIATGAIDLSHMSSQSVDEDNLHISNAGSNGQFLSKQSGDAGGLTWAAAVGLGKIVQIKSMSTTTLTSTTGNTYVATGLTLAFAQVTAGNYIHISATGPGGLGTSSSTTQARGHWALFRDASEIAKTSANIIQEHTPAGDWADGGWNVTVPWYGSVGDTTSYTYTLQLKAQDSSTATTAYFGYVMSGASTSTITIMEFAA